MDCLFCKIADGSIPVSRVYEDADVIAFADIHPQAPVHLLVIPRRHIGSLAQAAAQDTEMLGALLSAAGSVARAQGLDPAAHGGGYRLVINTGPNGGQTVDHLHIHVLGGRQMHWPPG